MHKYHGLLGAVDWCNHRPPLYLLLSLPLCLITIVCDSLELPFKFCAIVLSSSFQWDVPTQLALPGTLPCPAPPFSPLSLYHYLYYYYPPLLLFLLLFHYYYHYYTPLLSLLFSPSSPPLFFSFLPPSPGVGQSSREGRSPPVGAPTAHSPFSEPTGVLDMVQAAPTSYYCDLTLITPFPHRFKPPVLHQCCSYILNREPPQHIGHIGSGQSAAFIPRRGTALSRHATGYSIGQPGAIQDPAAGSVFRSPSCSRKGRGDHPIGGFCGL